MKTRLAILALFPCAMLSAPAQVQQSRAATPPAPALTATAPQGAFAPTERGGYHTRWTRVESETNSAGRVFTCTNSIVELGAGLNRQAGTQWVASTPEIEPAPGGARGSQARHQVQFSSNLKTRGAVEITGPDGRKIRSHLIGLIYYDTASSNSVVIAETKSSLGQILPSKTQVLYADGFAGVKADVRYTYTAAGLEQDVILREQLPAPEAYGMDPNTTELEVLTEYLDAPTKRTVGVSDDEIAFGSMHLAKGHAFWLGQTNGYSGYLKVSKRWAQAGGRQFLIESVSASAARKASEHLAKTHASILKHKALPAQQFPAFPETAKPAEAMMLAKVTPAAPGFVLDWYLTLSTDSVDSYTFQAGTMYLITDVFTVTNATFEGGTVLKFGPVGGLAVSNIVSTATQFEPITFTSQEDTNISWDVSTGIPITYDSDALLNIPWLTIAAQDGAVAIANMHFRAAFAAVAFLGSSLDVWDCQFVNCTWPIVAAQGLFDSNETSQTNCLALHNVLFSACFCPVITGLVPYSRVSGEHVTADAFNTFCTAGAYELTQLQLTNSIFTDGDWPYVYIADIWIGWGDLVPDISQVVWQSDSTGIYTNVGAGNYYLADASLRQTGDTNISPQMALELKQKTTVPPLLVTNTTIGDVTCPIQAEFPHPGETRPLISLTAIARRDAGQPDIGYHYAPIDYFVDCFAVTNATVRIREGTVIAYGHTHCGIWLGDNAEIRCIGTPLARNVFVSYSAIQEQPVNLGSGQSAAYSRIINSWRPTGGLAPAIFRFTDFLSLPGHNDTLSARDASGYDPLVIRDCRMVNGRISWWPEAAVAYDVKNSVFEYVRMDADQSSGGDLSLAACNNLFHNSSLSVHTDSGWTIRDNAFDASAFNITVGTSVELDHNAYLNGADPLSNNVLPDDIVTNLTWVTGPLGNYYQPPDSALIDQGSTNADVMGLYAYTVLTNQTPEGTTTVDIGAHYPAIILPVIVQQPASQMVVDGGSVTFSVVVTNTLVLSYQWTFNGAAIPGATASSLAWSNAQAADAGNYAVVVTNIAGSVISSNAALMVMSWLADSDYDGRSDAQEVLDSTDPFDPNSFLPVRLGHWRFDNTNTWAGEQGQLPLSVTNIAGVPSWSTNAARIDNTNGAILRYRDVETNGLANITCHRGTVRFWFRPDWSSTSLGGNAPCGLGRLIEVGSRTFGNGWWGLVVSSNGNQLMFETQTHESAEANLSAAISWRSNVWYQLVLVYTPTNSALSINGEFVTNGTGVGYFPEPVERAGSGLRIGSDQDGFNQAAGAFDELETFNYPLDTPSIQANYQAALAAGLDSDGDGLTDLEELGIPIDVDHPELGHLDPLNPDTGNTGVPDGQKDSDHDGLSNYAEIHIYGSDPANPHSFNAYKVDSEYFHTARAGESPTVTETSFSLQNLGGGRLGGTISSPMLGSSWDLYYVNSIIAQRWQWRRVLAGIQCDDAGEAMFQLQKPDPVQGYFVILSAEESDGSGLSDGYKAWFHYSGRRMTIGVWDSDHDLMRDGWEVEYGLDPTDPTGNNGGGVDRNGDGLTNLQEHDHYYAAARGYDAAYDPLKAWPNRRPVVTIAPADPPTIGFTISRDVGQGGSKPDLRVYYAVGGSAEYGTDYTLDPTPIGLPAIYAVDITGSADSVTVAITPTAAGLAKGPLSVVAALTPYSVAAQESNPLNWLYAVDWNHNRATNYFAGRATSGGFTINLDRDTTSGYLTIKPTANTTPLPYVNLASSGRGTVTRIEVPSQWNPSLTSPKVVGEYYTSPYDTSTQAYDGDPSRTTVDRYGNVWVANRRDWGDGAGSITKIGVVIGGTRCNADGSNNANGEYVKHDPPNHPIIYNTCIDRNGDGLIHTSNRLPSGQLIRLPWTDPTLTTPGDGDEAVLAYVRTTPICARALALDRDNNVWVGSKDNGWHELIDSVAGAPVTGQKYYYGSGGYGAVMDPYGVLWSSGYYYDGVLRLAPGPIANALPGTAGAILPDPSSPDGTRYAYGIGIDPTTADVWAGDFYDGGLWHFKQSGCTFKFAFSANDNPSGDGLKGVVADGTGNIWVAHPGKDNTGQSVYRFRDTPAHPGEYLGRVILTLGGVTGNAPHGVCIDSQGFVWAICFGPSGDGHCYAMRIDPTQGMDPDGSGNVVGSVDKAVDLGVFPSGAGPYNYSDMTGFVTLGTTQPAGVWDFVQDSGANYTLWSSVTLDGDLNSGNIIIEVRAADRITDLPSWPFRRLTASTGTIPFGTPALKGHYLETRVTLLRNFGATQSPVVRKLSLAWGAPGSDLQITSHPRSQIVDLGGSATFTVSATPTGLSYQWFKDGVAVGTGTSLTVNNAQYANAGLYHVRVTDASGTSLDSAEARLHINSTPGYVQPTEADSSFPTVGQSVALSAWIYAPPSPGPVHYQLRKNGVPVPGKFDLCTTSDNQTYTAACTIGPVASADTGEYSVVFTNDYWKVASPGVSITVVDESSQLVPIVTVTPTSVQITDIHSPPTLTASADPSFTPTCQQWYQTDAHGGTYFKKLIPNATGMSYTFPNPVTCDSLGWGYFVIEVFDQDHVPHPSSPVHVYGVCQ